MTRFTTANCITFKHYRIDNTYDQSGEFGVGTRLFGILPLACIKDMSVGKEAVRKYIAFESQKSFYLPTGMVGPMIKMALSIKDITGWNNVYSNDILEVVEFNYPSYTPLFAQYPAWWVNSISFTTKTGSVYAGKLRYTCELELVQKTV